MGIGGHHPQGGDGAPPGSLSILTRMNSTGTTWWPTLCRVCRHWQQQMLCGACVELAALRAPRCPRCGLAHAAPPDGSPAGTAACTRCEDWPPSFDHALAALDYVAPWSSLIASLKFRQDPSLAGFLGGMLAQQIERRWASPMAGASTRHHPMRGGTAPRVAGQSSANRRTAMLGRGAPTVVLPVPLSAGRLRERGYNQAWLLARAAARPWRLPLLPDGLIRQRETARLMSLDADERSEQIRGAFSVNPKRQSEIAGRHVAVVDDVLTTGATLNEIASTLWQAGAREVSVWVIARTPPPLDDQA
ncbi:MAG: ComF family protein [Rubrivivax sp.]|nr:MAG: ComF family protein [Rubrivivax sp.]